MSGGWNLSQLPVDLHSIWGVKILMGCLIISQHFFLPCSHQNGLKISSSQFCVSQHFSLFNILFALFPFFYLTQSILINLLPPLSAPFVLQCFAFSPITIYLSPSLPLCLQLYYSILSCLRHFRQAERRMTVLKQQKDECVLKEEKTRQYMGAVLAAAEHISTERDQLLQMVPLVLLLHRHNRQTTDIHEFNLHGDLGKSPEKIIRKWWLHQEKHLVQTSCLFRTFNMGRSDFSSSTEASCWHAMLPIGATGDT